MPSADPAAPRHTVLTPQQQHSQPQPQYTLPVSPTTHTHVHTRHTRVSTRAHNHPTTPSPARPGYDKERDGPLPCLMWAYPREFKSKDAAGQLRRSPCQFSGIGSSGPLLWLARKYAVLDGPTFPIVAEGEEEPNDTYVEQLTASARAAVEVRGVCACFLHLYAGGWGPWEHGEGRDGGGAWQVPICLSGSVAGAGTTREARCREEAALDSNPQ